MLKIDFSFIERLILHLQKNKLPIVHPGFNCENDTIFAQESVTEMASSPLIYFVSSCISYDNFYLILMLFAWIFCILDLP